MGLLNQLNPTGSDNHLKTTINRIFASSAHSRLQLVRSNKNREVFLIEEQGRIYYLKRFFASSTIEKLKNIVLNKAVNSLRLSHRLMSTGFLVAEPVLATKCRKNGESIYVTKKLAGTPLDEFLSSDIPKILKEKAVNQFVITIANLFKKGFIHCDPALSNFLIQGNNNHYEVGLVDLDAIIHLPRPINMITYKNLAKLYTFSSNFSEFNNQQQALKYLKNFIEIYNNKLNHAKVQESIGRMVTKRIRRLAG